MNRSYFFILFLLVFFACSEDDMTDLCEMNIPSGTRYFEFFHESTGDMFVAWTANTQVLQVVDEQLGLPENERTQHINGKILRDEHSCGFNGNWSWYFDPADWALADFSIELCDGNPQYVEENLDEYVRTGRYCPWGSTISREITKPF